MITDQLLEQIQNNTYKGDTLDLRKELIRKDVLKKLSDALKSNTTIRKINLSGNLIDDEQLLILVEGLEQRPLLGGEGLELILSRNQITKKGIKALASLKDLKALDVSSNKDMDIDDAKILAKKHPGLSKLSLSGNELGEGVLELFEGNTSLTELDLSGNGIDGTGLKHVTDIPTLTTLKLASNSISDDKLKVMEGNQSLRRVDLKFNLISDDGLSSLGKTKIESLNLFDSTVTNQGLENLLATNQQNGETIRKLELTQTHVTEEDVDSIFKKYTKLEVVGLDLVDKTSPFKRESVASASSNSSPDSSSQSFGSEVKLHFPQSPTALTSSSPNTTADAKTNTLSVDGFFSSSEKKTTPKSTLVSPTESVPPKSPLSDTDATDAKVEADIIKKAEEFAFTLSLEKAKAFEEKLMDAIKRVCDGKQNTAITPVSPPSPLLG